MRYLLFIFISLVLLSGCAGLDLPPTAALDLPATSPALPTDKVIKTDNLPALPTKESSPMTPTGTAMPLSEFLDHLVQLAKQDLADRLPIAVSQITLIEAREVVWSDSSVGCPQPGMMYAQVLTPGYLILLSGNNIHYEYHSGRDGEVFYCENPTPPVPGEPSDI